VCWKKFLGVANAHSVVVKVKESSRCRSDVVEHQQEEEEEEVHSMSLHYYIQLPAAGGGD
jgi:hypothetical protein